MSQSPLPIVLHGRYRLDEILRRAAATTTYGGIDQQSGLPVVVKELRVGELGEWKEYDLFEREVETLRSLEHPGIPRLVDHFRIEEPGHVRVVLVMSRMPGEPLDRRLASGRAFSPAEGRRLLEGLLDILEYLHGLSPAVVHRDLKPSNVLVDGQTVYLVDFGGVRRYLPWAKDGSTMVGTFGYLAPEQLHGEATPASDLYSLGATVLALLTGREASELPRRGLRIDLEALQLDRFPPELVEVLRGLSEPEPAARLRSVAEVRRALGSRAPRGGRSLATVSSVGEALPALRASGYWMVRRVARWLLAGSAGMVFLGAALMEVLLVVTGAAFFGELAMGLGLGSLGLGVCALAVKTRAAFQRRLLRLARRRHGQLHLTEVVEKLNLPVERAEELLENIVGSGMARRDPREPRQYLIGPDRGQQEPRRIGRERSRR